MCSSDLSRIPPRSAIVAFSAEQVYTVAEMLRRFRGGAAVVMGALSPETRNKQVALYQSGEVDYLVATDAIGMGLNLDVSHVAFAGLSKFDGQRQRRLTTSEMAQIAGRAGRHQRDGTFGTLAGSGGRDAEFTADEIFAIEEHRFPPLTRLFWREAEPDCSSLAGLIADLERAPDRPELASAPEAIDLAVLKRLAEEPDIAAGLRGQALVSRFWEVCSLPDFRQHGAETHARFVARLWEDLRRGQLGSDYVARAIADLDRPDGDIDTLQMRIAAIRSWAYIAQRPDWVLAREEMAARARAAEARLSDALHARLTERFVNRRTAVLMKRLGPDAGLLAVQMEGSTVLVDGEPLGDLHAFRFHVDPQARLADRKLLLAAAERHLPDLLGKRADALVSQLEAGEAELSFDGAEIDWAGETIARIGPGRQALSPRIALDQSLDALSPPRRNAIKGAVTRWVEQQLAALDPLRKLDAASRDQAGGPELRSLLIRLVEAGGILARDGNGLDQLNPQQRKQLARLGVTVGALDLFIPAMLRPAARSAWRTLRAETAADSAPGAPAVIPASRKAVPPGYRGLGKQALRIDLVEKLVRAAHGVRVAAGCKLYALDPALAVSMGLTTASYAQLLRQAGFQPVLPRALAEGAHGPVQPLRWRWRPIRRAEAEPARTSAPATGAFAALAGLVR